MQGTEGLAGCERRFGPAGRCQRLVGVEIEVAVEVRLHGGAAVERRRDQLDGRDLPAREQLGRRGEGECEQIVPGRHQWQPADLR